VTVEVDIPVDAAEALRSIEAAQREWETDRTIVALDVLPLVRTGKGLCIGVTVEITRWREPPPCPPPAQGVRWTREDDR
jgi:hypothetical protein